MVVYRIDEDLARDQAQWFVIGLIVFVVTIIALRDFRDPRALPVHDRARRPGAAACCRACPGIGQQVNGAYLGVKVGPISFQPAEFGKIAIVIFLAAYLRDTRQVLVQSSRRFLGVTIPRFKHLGPLLVVWGAAMLMLVFIRDLGSSLMYFGAFLALIYVATNRLSFVVVGLVLFGVGAWFFATTVGHVAGPHRHLAGPVPALRRARATRSPTACSRWPTAGCSGRGSGAALLKVPGGGAAAAGAADRHDLRRHRQ